MLESVEGDKPDVVLVFHVRRFPSRSRWNPMVEKGWGMAFCFKSGNTRRVLWKFEDSRTWARSGTELLGCDHVKWERAPSTNFARNFIKLYKKLHTKKEK